MIETIDPPGSVSDETIVQHSYLFIRQDGPVQSVPVYAPIDSELVNVTWYGEGGEEQYLLTFQVSCALERAFDAFRLARRTARTNQAFSDSFARKRKHSLETTTNNLDTGRRRSFGVNPFRCGQPTLC